MQQILQAWAVLQAALCLGVPPALVVTNGAGEEGRPLVVGVEEVLTERPESVRPQTSTERVAWARCAEKWWLEVEIVSAEVGDERARVELKAELRSPDRKLRFTAKAVGSGSSAGDATCAAAERLIEDLGKQVTTKAAGTTYDRSGTAPAPVRHRSRGTASWLPYSLAAYAIYLAL